MFNFSFQASFKSKDKGCVYFRIFKLKTKFNKPLHTTIDLLL